MDGLITDQDQALHREDLLSKFMSIHNLLLLVAFYYFLVLN